MSKPAKIIVRSLIGVIVLLILLYLFLPIKPRLSLLGYKLESDVYGFTVGNTTYQLEIDSNEIAAITTDYDSDQGDDITASFTFFDDSRYAARVTVERDNETSVCIYTPGFNSTLTCEDITLTEATRDTLKEQVEYHLILISFEFDWTYIPDYQR